MRKRTLKKAAQGDATDASQRDAHSHSAALAHFRIDRILSVNIGTCSAIASLARSLPGFLGFCSGKGRSRESQAFLGGKFCHENVDFFRGR